jgi:hypothetical protein
MYHKCLFSICVLVFSNLSQAGSFCNDLKKVSEAGDYSYESLKIGNSITTNGNDIWKPKIDLAVNRNGNCIILKKLSEIDVRRGITSYVCNFNGNNVQQATSAGSLLKDIQLCHPGSFPVVESQYFVSVKINDRTIAGVVVNRNTSEPELILY